MTKENTAADGIGRHFHSYSFHYFDHKGLKEKSQIWGYAALCSLNHKNEKNGSVIPFFPYSP